MCLTSGRGLVPCREGMSGPPWLSLPGKSDDVLWETWERRMQRTRRLEVEKSQLRATLHTFFEFRALPLRCLQAPDMQIPAERIPTDTAGQRLEAGELRPLPTTLGTLKSRNGPDSHLICFSGCMPRTAVAMGKGNRSRVWSDLHSQFAFSGAKILRMSILLRPWDVSRMTSGATPISFPTLRTDCQRAAK